LLSLRCCRPSCHYLGDELWFHKMRKSLLCPTTVHHHTHVTADFSLARRDLPLCSPHLPGHLPDPQTRDTVTTTCRLSLHLHPHRLSRVHQQNLPVHTQPPSLHPRRVVQDGCGLDVDTIGCIFCGLSSGGDGQGRDA
jgi:hypothetical protein